MNLGRVIAGLGAAAGTTRLPQGSDEDPFGETGGIAAAGGMKYSALVGAGAA